jgi:hypothetical protein
MQRGRPNEQRQRIHIRSDLRVDSCVHRASRDRAPLCVEVVMIMLAAHCAAAAVCGLILWNEAGVFSAHLFALLGFANVVAAALCFAELERALKRSAYPTTS